jgi:hypothetical protein
MPCEFWWGSLRSTHPTLFPQQKPSTMKVFRYRRPSLRTLLGITKAKKRIKKELGITDALKHFRAWTNAKRQLKRKIGYESAAGRLVRNGQPRPGGYLVVLMVMLATAAAAVSTVVVG